MNYKKHEIEFPNWKQTCSFKRENGKVPTILYTRLKEHHSLPPIFDIPDNCFLYNISIITQFLKPPLLIHNQQPSQEQITNKFVECVSELVHLNTVQKKELIELLEEYQSIFSDRPGLNKLLHVDLRSRKKLHSKSVLILFRFQDDLQLNVNSNV